MLSALLRSAFSPLPAWLGVKSPAAIVVRRPLNSASFCFIYKFVSICLFLGWQRFTTSCSRLQENHHKRCRTDDHLKRFGLGGGGVVVAAAALSIQRDITFIRSKGGVKRLLPSTRRRGEEEKKEGRGAGPGDWQRPLHSNRGQPMGEKPRLPIRKVMSSEWNMCFRTLPAPPPPPLPPPAPPSC